MSLFFLTSWVFVPGHQRLISWITHLSKIFQQMLLFLHVCENLDRTKASMHLSQGSHVRIILSPLLSRSQKSCGYYLLQPQQSFDKVSHDIINKMVRISQIPQLLDRLIIGRMVELIEQTYMALYRLGTNVNALSWALCCSLFLLMTSISCVKFTSS